MPQQNNRVLVVEDNVDLALLMTTMFRNAGCEVNVAATGADAIADVVAAPPALVLLDIELPDLDGWEVARRINSLELTQSVPIVVTTAMDAPSPLPVAVAEYLVKPFPMAEVERLAEQYLQPAADNEDNS